MNEWLKKITVMVRLFWGDQRTQLMMIDDGYNRRKKTVTQPDESEEI